VRWPEPDADYSARTAADVLAALPPDGALWIFAIGSLIWNPRFPVAERRPASIRGWHRAFCLGPDTRHRGNPEAPGLMMSLDRGGQCRGIVLRVNSGGLAASLDALLRKEPPTPPSWVRAATPEGPVRAIAFTIARGHFGYAGRLTENEIADRLSRAVGHFGSRAEYLLTTVTHLEAAGIHDHRLWRMQALVAARLERMPLREDDAGDDHGNS
jgi:cation transport protein ChaC